MCCSTVYRAAPGPPGPKEGGAVTAEDVQQVHALLERCIQRGMSKAEAAALLARLGVAPKFTLLVWERLEAENPEFFAAYALQLSATAQLARCQM